MVSLTISCCCCRTHGKSTPQTRWSILLFVSAECNAFWINFFNTYSSFALYWYMNVWNGSNGLAPDNLFFHGVAANCVKIQLSHLGLDTEFAQCEIQIDEKDWDGVRRKYWHGRNTYYLPIATWKKWLNYLVSCSALEQQDTYLSSWSILFS